MIQFTNIENALTSPDVINKFKEGIAMRDPNYIKYVAYRNKSVNGAIAFFVATIIVSIVYINLLTLDLHIGFALLMAGVLTLTEIYSHPFDDNLTIILVNSLLVVYLL